MNEREAYYSARSTFMQDHDGMEPIDVQIWEMACAYQRKTDIETIALIEAQNAEKVASSAFALERGLALMEARMAIEKGTNDDHRN